MDIDLEDFLNRVNKNFYYICSMKYTTEHKLCGVYTITNIVTGKLYVGSTTKSFIKRWNDHKSLLRNNIHHNVHLQRSWNKYGEFNFKFEILVTCDAEFCISTEQFWINELGAYKFGYNRNPTAKNSTGTKRSEETLIKMRNCDNYKQANKAWKGKNHLEATKEIIRLKRSKQDMSWMQSLEYKAKRSKQASEILIGNTRRKGTGKYCKCEKLHEDGSVLKTFSHIREAFLEEGMPGISKIVRSAQTGMRVKGYKWNVYYKDGTKVEKLGINSVNCLGNPEEGNQQPSSCGDTEKGSTTSSESQVDNNSATKAGHHLSEQEKYNFLEKSEYFDEDIV